MFLVRNIASILLLGVFLLSSTGIVQSKHYCMGRLMSVAYFGQADNCAGDPDMEDPMPCCKDVKEIIKVEDVSVSHFNFDFHPVAFLIFQLSCDLIERQLEVSQPKASIHTSWPPPKIPLTILFENLRI